jgi:membrane protein required for colicin V production
MAWPDTVALLVLIFGALRGWRVGLVGELTGMVALAAAVVAGFTYPGIWDGAVHERTNLAPGSAHVVGLIAYALAAYGIVFLAGSLLGRIAKLPIIGTLNAALGAAIGLVKMTILLWAVLYIALFFPIPSDLRRGLHDSHAVALLQSPNARIDDTLRSTLPPVVQPYSSDLFARHRV